MITQASLVGVHDRMTYKPLLVFKLVLTVNTYVARRTSL